MVCLKLKISVHFYLPSGKKEHIKKGKSSEKSNRDDQKALMSNDWVWYVCNLYEKGIENHEWVETNHILFSTTTQMGVLASLGLVSSPK